MTKKTLLNGTMAFFCVALVAYAQEDRSDSRSSERESQRNRENRENREDRESSEPSTQDRSDARRDSSRERMEDREQTREDREDREDRRNDRRTGISFRNNRRGLIVGNIDPVGAAARVGLRVGDQVLSVSERPVETAAQFSRLIGNAAQQVPITVWRNGRERTIMWSNDQGNMVVRSTNNRDSYRDRDNNERHDYDRDDESDDDQEPREAFLGVVFDTRFDDAAVVRQVYRNSPAQLAGVQPGSTILSINGDKVDCPEDVTEAVANLEPGEAVEMMISPSAPRMVEVQLASRQQRHSSGYRGTQVSGQQSNQGEDQDRASQNADRADDADRDDEDSGEENDTPELESEDEDSSPESESD